MNTARLCASLGAVLALTAAAYASPLKVRTNGTKSQNVTMCPDCKEKISCAKVGDYTIGFSADLDNVKTGTSKVAVHVRDNADKPEDDAKVEAVNSKPKHGHQPKAHTLKNAGHGMYSTTTQLQMPGAWQADVEVIPAGGDTVKQSFSFSK
jgi:hypothetical protein